ncbi:MAG TPA: hypothetical protein VJQ52_01285 [Steroidobacteraceae bacterium]|nr:hypothetical protein [Steroidobacteraceae bacterium]
MNISIAGSGLASLSYVLFSSAVGLVIPDGAGATSPQPYWAHGTTNLAIEPGLMPISSAVYVMKTSEEESFFKALRRSRNVVHRGTLR